MSPSSRGRHYGWTVRPAWVGVNAPWSMVLFEGQSDSAVVGRRDRQHHLLPAWRPSAGTRCSASSAAFVPGSAIASTRFSKIVVAGGKLLVCPKLLITTPPACLYSNPRSAQVSNPRCQQERRPKAPPSSLSSRCRPSGPGLRLRETHSRQAPVPVAAGPAHRVSVVQATASGVGTDAGAVTDRMCTKLTPGCRRRRCAASCR